MLNHGMFRVKHHKKLNNWVKKKIMTLKIVTGFSINHSNKAQKTMYQLKITYMTPAIYIYRTLIIDVNMLH